jgi:uncharacterized membrane protein YfcA
MDWAGVAAVVVAVALGAFVKGITGAGLPLIAIPVLATVVGPEEAVVVMTIPTLLSNLMMIRAHRRPLRDVPDLAPLLVAGVIGTAIGVWLLRELSPDALSLVLAGTVILYVVVRILRPEMRLSSRVSRFAAAPVSFAAGTLQGAAGVSGPLLASYLHSYRMDRSTYLFALTVLLQVFGLAQIIGVAVTGLYSADRLLISTLAVIPVAIVMPLGIALSRRLSTAGFDRLVLIVLVASAMKLVANTL